jgi:hypothetical protein
MEFNRYSIMSLILWLLLGGEIRQTASPRAAYVIEKSGRASWRFRLWVE